MCVCVSLTQLRLQSEVVNVRAAGASSRNVQNILEVAEGAVRAVDNLVVLVDRAWAAGLRSSAGAEL